MISTGELKKGATIELDGKLMSILDYTHIKMGRGSAQVRIKFRDVRTGSITEQTFQAGTKFQRARVERREMQYLYNDGEFYHFMNTDGSFEQVAADKNAVADAIDWLKEQDVYTVMMWNGAPISVTPPNFVELEVVETDPGIRGDTATGGTKPAKLSSGAVVKVPLFVEIGDVLRVDTRSGEYVSRAKK